MDKITILYGRIEESSDIVFDLLQKNICEVVYNKSSSTDKSEKLNDKLLNDCSNKALVYSINIKENDTWKCMYVGQTQAETSKTRIRNHLFKKDHRTGSVLEKVNEIYKSNCIGYSAVEIDPPIMRHAVEAIIIAKQYGKLLQWNKDGTK